MTDVFKGLLKTLEIYHGNDGSLSNDKRYCGLKVHSIPVLFSERTDFYGMQAATGMSDP